MADAVPAPFAYPATAHAHVHGPSGYLRYKAYKPWLRDEFIFRCVFCLTREIWYPNGQDAFHVEHLKPRSLAPELELDYTNLVYSCGSCNSFKQDNWPVLSPFDNAYAAHFKVNNDGTIEGLSDDAWRSIRFLRLDREKLNKFRKDRIDKIRTLWEWRHDPHLAAVLRNELKYPDDLPKLNRRQKNNRKENIATCHLERARRGELPETY